MRKILIVPGDLLLEVGTSAKTMALFTITSRSAESAADALSQAAEWRPDLVLFDAELSGMTVAEFCRAVRASAPATKLLMLTRSLGADGLGMDESEHDGHLVLPVDKAQLVLTMAALIGAGEEGLPVAALESLVSIRGGGASLLATALSVSEMRLRVEAQDRLEVGAWVQVRFTLPGSLDSISAKCVVQCLIDEMKLRYDLRFVQMEDSHRKRLAEYASAGGRGGAP